MSEHGPEDLLYLDTSALIKLVIAEDETEALSAELAGWPDHRFITSALTGVELHRAVRHATDVATANQAVDAILSATYLVPVSDAVLRMAAILEPAALRFLDAIQLASALSLPDAPRFCGYDDSLLAAAERHKLVTIHPS